VGILVGGTVIASGIVAWQAGTASAAIGLDGTGTAAADDGAAITSETQVDPRTIDVRISSPALGFTAPVRVLLPADWNSQPSQPWPALYLLSGSNDQNDYQDWTINTDVENVTANSDALVVMPSDGVDGMYSAWWNYGGSSKPDYETFHTTELPQILTRDFRAGTRRAVAGISIGGFGALAYSFRHPGIFQAAYSYSGVPNTQLPSVQQFIQWGVLARDGSNPWALWGDPYMNINIWNAHNPYNYPQAFRNMTVFLSAGNGSPGPLDVAGSATQYGDIIEPFVVSSSQSFSNLLTQQGIPVTTDYYGNGTHSWPYWKREFDKTWPSIASSLGLPG
jgi:S-formylglutathione hydrolase FrmB